MSNPDITAKIREVITENQLKISGLDREIRDLQAKSDDCQRTIILMQDLLGEEAPF